MKTAGIITAPQAPGAAAVSDYDLMPYVSLPVQYAQPSQLAAMAQLHGLRTPPAERARVLELGCAAGGNLIPLAARFPDARFVGIDLSRRHVDEAVERIRSLRLRNIEVQQGDLARLDLGDQRFDYIICHGVFSWVPPAVQEAILVLCASYLAADGVATISYNVLPGWFLRLAVRDICLLHAGAGGPWERVERARAILTQVARGSIKTAYGQVVAAEAKRLARMPGSYILGEFLAEHNAPCHFEDFVAQAGAHGLRWLSEADLASTLPRAIAPKSATAICELAGNDPVRIQAYLDHFSGRTFRRSILVRAAAHASATAPVADSLAGLHFSGRFVADGAPAADGMFHFSDARGRRVSSNHRPTVRMLQEFERRYPATIALADLEAEPGGVDQQLRTDLLRLIEDGRAAASSLPLQPGNAHAERPAVWPFARLEAARGQPWATSQLHTAVLLNPRLRQLVGLMDGRKDRRALAAAFPLELGGDGAEDFEAALAYLSVNGLIES